MDPWGHRWGALGRDPCGDPWGDPWVDLWVDPWADPWGTVGGSLVGTLGEPWGSLGGALGEPWGTLLGALRGTLGEPVGGSLGGAVEGSLGGREAPCKPYRGEDLRTQPYGMHTISRVAFFATLRPRHKAPFCCEETQSCKKRNPVATLQHAAIKLCTYAMGELPVAVCVYVCVCVIMALPKAPDCDVCVFGSPWICRGPKFWASSASVCVHVYAVLQRT